MGKIVRPAYPKELSIGVLLLVYSMSFLLSGQVLLVHGINEDKNRYVGMALLSAAIILVVLILWEELLFPVKIKPEPDGEVFRNHRTKLLNQVLLYLAIPAIFAFIYMEYEVNLIRYILWASICTVLPVAGKLISGIDNYNDFLKLTNDHIEYKNNKKTGNYAIAGLEKIVLVKDERKVLHKVQLVTKDNQQITIDLDEMEIDDFVLSIEEFINMHYKNLVRS